MCTCNSNGNSCPTSLSSCNAACGGSSTTAPATPSGVMVGVSVFSSNTACINGAAPSFYMLVEVNRCDNLHGTGSSILVTDKSGNSYSYTLFSNYECSASSPTILDVTLVSSGICRSFQSFSLAAFTPTQSSPAVPMTGTYTQTSCSSPTNPTTTCSSVLQSSYTMTQAGYGIAWSGPSSSGTVYDRGLVAIRTTSGTAYGSCYGWMDGLNLRIDCFTNSASATPRLEAVYSCSGVCSNPTTLATSTTLSQSTTTPTTSPSNVCFHESTLITYKGKEYSMKELSGECRVPHVIKSTDGVIIKTSCSSLQLTSDHLVFTGSGLKSAGAIIKGDILFADTEERMPCKVISVTKSSKEQTYFGVNCLESTVLANGIKTSTFGKYHTIPAFWMKYASKIFGIERASSIGDSLVSMLIKMNLI
jgi:hypothetical protein